MFEVWLSTRSPLASIFSLCLELTLSSSLGHFFLTRLNNVSIDYFSFRCAYVFSQVLCLPLPVNWFSLHLTIFLCSDTLFIDFIIYFSKNNLITSIYKLSGVLCCPQVPISVQTRKKPYPDISWIICCSKDIKLLSQISNIEQKKWHLVKIVLKQNKGRSKRFFHGLFWQMI